MENSGRSSNQGGQTNQKPGQGAGQHPGSEGRGTEGQHGDLDQGTRTGQADNEGGGSQGPGEIPNPDNVNDRGSLSGFDGNAAEDSDVDGDGSEQGLGAGQHRT